jgi:hypothetical protein
VGEAGEDIRWVPSRLVSAVATPGNDFYLFDGRLAVFPLNGQRLFAGMDGVDDLSNPL